MSTKAERERARQGEQVRALVATFDHQEAYLVSQACVLRAAVLDQLDSMYPDPERRAHADQLRGLAELLRNANTARAYIEQGDQE